MNIKPKSLALLCASIILITVFACSKSSVGPGIKYSKTDSIIAPNIKINQFRLIKIMEFGDSINSYFQTFNWGEIDYQYNGKIDTTISENGICYSYSKIGVPFSINEFKTSKLATDYFNELLTIELVAYFGINKRPNHILVDSNKVYWIKMEHSYGHRMDDIKNIFKEVFNFKPKSTNLDSISGFNYCRYCSNIDTSLNDIIGIWSANNYIEIDSTMSSDTGYKRIINSETDTLVFQINKDSIIINNESYLYNVWLARKLPDAKYYWESRYTYVSFDLRNKSFTPEFQENLKLLTKYRGEIFEYYISLTNGGRKSRFSLVRTSENEIYVKFSNRFYILHKHNLK